MALPCEDDLSVVHAGERCAPSPRPRDRRGADEDASERTVEALHRQVRLERLPLAPERVPINRDLHQGEEPRPRVPYLVVPFLGKKDAACTRPEDGHALARAADDVVMEPRPHEE